MAASSSSQMNERTNTEMNLLPDVTKVVMQKLQKIDPENTSKIVGHLLSQEHSEQELTNLAHVSDDMFATFIGKTREELNLPPITSRNDKQPPTGSKLSTNFTPFIPSSARYPRPPPPAANNVQTDIYTPVVQPVIYGHAVPFFRPPNNGVGFHHHPHFLPVESQMEHGFHHIPERAWTARPRRGPVFPDPRFHQQQNDGYYPEADDFHTPADVWIKKLELELIQILKSKGPRPIPISTLPALYSANFGLNGLNIMRARVGGSLHTLLAQMSRRIRLIERPCGEQCVMLSEHVPSYVKSVEAKKEKAQAANLSRQIYLTFSHSTFSSQDVYDYFSTFGPVIGVKIPNLKNRVFGFVTFTYPATAAIVLAMRNPHFIRGTQVMAKLYKGRDILDRKACDEVRPSLWSMTEEDSHRLARARLGFNPKRQPTTEDFVESPGIRPEETTSVCPIPGTETEDTISSAHIPSIDADAGPGAPTGISIGSAENVQSIVPYASNEERYYGNDNIIWADANEAARHYAIRENMWADANEAARFYAQRENIWADANETARFYARRENIWAVSDEEARYFATLENLRAAPIEQESYNDKSMIIWTGATGEASSNDKGKGIWTDAVGETSFNDEGKIMWAGAAGEASYNDKAMIMWNGATGEASSNDIGKSIWTDAVGEARIDDKGENKETDGGEETGCDDLKLPESPFAFDENEYDFFEGSEWDLNNFSHSDISRMLGGSEL